jgi:hypothetical protein
MYVKAPVGQCCGSRWRLTPAVAALIAVTVAFDREVTGPVLLAIRVLATQPRLGAHVARAIRTDRTHGLSNKRGEQFLGGTAMGRPSRRIEVSRVINAPAMKVFAFLATPDNHVALDTSGMIRGSADHRTVTEAGAV